MKLIKILGASLTLLASLAYADPSIESVRKALPEIENIYSVKPTPIKGVFEVLGDANVVYVSEDLKYVISGHILDVASKKSLTAPVLAEIQQKDANRKMIELEKMQVVIQKELVDNQKNFIKEVKGTGAQTLYMVTDIRCGFCKQMEKTLDALNNVTIYRIPVAFLGPDSKTLGDAAWCSNNNLTAWKESASNAAKTTTTKTCNSPLESNNNLTKSWKVNGTPTLFKASGERWAQGYLTVEQTNLFLNQGANAVLKNKMSK